MGRAKRKSDQPTTASVTPLLAPLQALVDLLAQFENQGVIIGGIAASLLGAPRYTVDLDAVFLLGIDDIPRLLDRRPNRG